MAPTICSKVVFRSSLSAIESSLFIGLLHCRPVSARSSCLQSAETLFSHWDGAFSSSLFFWALALARRPRRGIRACAHLPHLLVNERDNLLSHPRGGVRRRIPGREPIGR